MFANIFFFRFSRCEIEYQQSFQVSCHATECEKSYGFFIVFLLLLLSLSNVYARIVHLIQTHKKFVLCFECVSVFFSLSSAKCCLFYAIQIDSIEKIYSSILK